MSLSLCLLGVHHGLSGRYLEIYSVTDTVCNANGAWNPNIWCYRDAKDGQSSISCPRRLTLWRLTKKLKRCVKVKSVDGNRRVSKAAWSAECDSRLRITMTLFTCHPILFPLPAYQIPIYLWRFEFYAKSITLLRVQYVYRWLKGRHSTRLKSSPLARWGRL